jgi:hypothetical protein
MEVLWVWIGAAAVVIALGLLLARLDRRGKRQGHVLRGAGEMASRLRTSNRRTYGVTARPERDPYSGEDIP